MPEIYKSNPHNSFIYKSSIILKNFTQKIHLPFAVYTLYFWHILPGVNFILFIHQKNGFYFEHIMSTWKMFKYTKSFISKIQIELLKFFLLFLLKLKRGSFPIRSYSSMKKKWRKEVSWRKREPTSYDVTKNILFYREEGVKCICPLYKMFNYFLFDFEFTFWKIILWNIWFYKQTIHLKKFKL